MAVSKKTKEVKRLFAIAGELDRRGKEAQAKTAYQNVLKIGINHLSPVDRRNFFLQYGSTLRNCGQFTSAESILKKGIRLYPDFVALKLFFALVQISKKQYLRANRTLFKVLIEDRPDGSIKRFERALRYYVKKL